MNANNRLNNLNTDEINQLLDTCNNNLSHFDLALVFFNIFKHKYRYLGKKKWEYYDMHSQVWLLDTNKEKLKDDLRNGLSEMFLTRSIYWYDLSINSIDLELIYKMRSERLLKARGFLRSDKFISILIREASAFFDIQNQC